MNGSRWAFPCACCSTSQSTRHSGRCCLWIILLLMDRCIWQEENLAAGPLFTAELCVFDNDWYPTPVLNWIQKMEIKAFNRAAAAAAGAGLDAPGGLLDHPIHGLTGSTSCEESSDNGSGSSPGSAGGPDTHGCQRAQSPVATAETSTGSVRTASPPLASAERPSGTGSASSTSASVVSSPAGRSAPASLMPAQQVPQQGSELPQAAAAAAAVCTAPAPSSPTGQVAAKEAMLNAAAVQVCLPPAPADAPMATAQQPAATVDPPPASVAPASPAFQLPVSTRPQHFTLIGSCDVRYGS